MSEDLETVIEKYTLLGLANKVEWEGGIEEAISYGIRAAEVPSSLYNDWREAEALLRKFQKVADRISVALDEEINKNEYEVVVND